MNQGNDSSGAKRRTEPIIRVRVVGVIRIPVTIRVHNRHGIRRTITSRTQPAKPKTQGSVKFCRLLPEK